MSLSIWYISKYISLPASGKWGTRGFMLAREWVRRGHYCLMLASDSTHLTDTPQFSGRSMTERVEGVDVCWIKTYKFDGAKSWGRILSWIDFEIGLLRLDKTKFPRPDVIVVSSLSLLSILNGILLKQRFGCKLVFEIRDIWPLTIVEEGGFRAWNPFVMVLGLVERLGYRRSDAIVGTMPNLIEHVAGLVDPHPPVYTIPIGFDPDADAEAVPLPPDWVGKYVQPGKFVICHAGTIGITNALEPLLACARLLHYRDDIQFLIVGEGGLREAYQRATSDLSNVTFTGPVAKQSVQEVLGHADLLYFSVHPSKVWRYGMSLNKAIDYLLSGKPILGSYSGYPTMVAEARGGSEVPAGDVQALADEILRYREMSEAERHAIGRNGRAWLLANRPYPKLAADYLTILEGGNIHSSG